MLIHLLDGAGADPLADFSQINTELALFDESLASKPQVVAFNKLDLPEAQAHWPQVKAELARRGYTVLSMSAFTRQGVREVLLCAAQKVAEAPSPAAAAEIPVYRPSVDETDFIISREGKGYRVRGAKIERAAKMTYWEYDEAVLRFQRLLEALGIHAALEKAGVQTGDTVYIGDYELEWRD